MLSASLEVARREIRQPGVDDTPIEAKCCPCNRGLLPNNDHCATVCRIHSRSRLPIAEPVVNHARDCSIRHTRNQPRKVGSSSALGVVGVQPAGVRSENARSKLAFPYIYIERDEQTLRPDRHAHLACTPTWHTTFVVHCCPISTNKSNRQSGVLEPSSSDRNLPKWDTGP